MVAGALGVWAALLMAACGGGDEESASAEDFHAEVDAVCARTTAEIKRLYKEEKPRIRPELARVQAERLEVSEQALAEIEGIDPPEELQEEFDAYLAQREEVIDLLREEQAANAELDAPEARRLAAEIADLEGPLLESAAAVGLRTCAGE